MFKRSLYILFIMLAAAIIAPVGGYAAPQAKLELPAPCDAAVVQWGAPDALQQNISGMWGQLFSIAQGDNMAIDAPAAEGGLIIIGADIDDRPVFRIYIDDISVYAVDERQPLNGWHMADGSWYYYEGGSAASGEWLDISGERYLFDDGGAMVTGWYKRACGLTDRRYYFHPDGAMATGWTEIDGSWHFFLSDGMLDTGWLRIGGSWYYADPASGGIIQGSNRIIDGVMYSFDAAGQLI